MDCIFCKIIEGSVPSKKVYEDDKILAFRDIAPKAPTHVLVIPKKHIASAADVKSEDAELMGHIWTAIPQIAETLGVKDSFRVLTNSGAGSGQVVFHLHFHILAP
jgi:histidine triad (HIT) family protein